MLWEPAEVVRYSLMWPVPELPPPAALPNRGTGMRDVRRLWCACPGAPPGTVPLPSEALLALLAGAGRFKMTRVFSVVVVVAPTAAVAAALCGR